MKRTIAFFFLTGLLVSGQRAFAQQDPIYAQYMLNPLTINPAYAGSNKMFNANVQYRTQWAGLPQNPVTISVSAHMSALQNRGGVGVMVIQDKLGDTKNTEFSSVFAYHLALKESTLSFGMQAGFTQYRSDPSGLTIRDPGDPSFVNLSEMHFNTGAGVLLKSDRYIAGISVPRLLPVTVSQGGQSIQLYTQTYYLFGSYVMFLSQSVRFKPSVLLRGVPGLPLTADVNATFTWKEQFSGGIFTRNLKTYGILLQAQVTKFRFGYAFELPGSPASSLNFNSHELSVGVLLGLLGYHDNVTKTY